MRRPISRMMMLLLLVLGEAGCAQLAPAENDVSLKYCSVISYEPCLDQARTNNCVPC